MIKNSGGNIFNFKGLPYFVIHKHFSVNYIALKYFGTKLIN